jgi:hypothetical protein
MNMTNTQREAAKNLDKPSKRIRDTGERKWRAFVGSSRRANLLAGQLGTWYGGMCKSPPSP